MADAVCRSRGDVGTPAGGGRLFLEVQTSGVPASPPLVPPATRSDLPLPGLDLSISSIGRRRSAAPAATWEGPHVTDTAEAAPTVEPGGRSSSARAGGGLTTKLLPELKQIAGGLGIRGVSAMKKAQLVEAIRAAQSGQAGQGKSA